MHTTDILPSPLKPFTGPDAARVYNYWFGHRTITDALTPVADPAAEHYLLDHKLWFRGGDDVDAEVRQEFGALVERAATGALDGWSDDPRDAVCLVVLLDQFPRHIHRGTARAFAHDDHARRIARAALDRGDAAGLAPAEALFHFMALMHAEDEPDVRRALEGIRELSTRCTRAQVRLARSWVRGAQKHLDVIQRFGRYPHRNELVGRESTEAERAFLVKPDFSALFMRSQQPKDARAETPAETPQDDEPGASVMTPHAGPRVRLLMLHGFRQNGEVFRRRVRKLRQALDDVAELVFVTSPIQYAPEGDIRDATVQAFGEVPEYPNQRVWWMSSEDNSVYRGVDASLAFLESVVKTQGPFDGVLGFAQGGTLAALLAAREPERHLGLRFAVCISSYRARAHALHALMTAGSVRLPALHVLGLNDILVTPDRSTQLYEVFAPGVATLLKHPGGHFVPASWPLQSIREFVLRFVPERAPDAPVATPEAIPSVLPTLLDALSQEPVDLPLAVALVRELAAQDRWEELTTAAVHNRERYSADDVERSADSARVAVYEAIVDMYAVQLRDDLRAVASQPPPAEAADRRGRLLALMGVVATEDAPAWPSRCGKAVPRIGSQPDKRCHLARDVALALFPEPQMRAFLRAVQASPGPRVDRGDIPEHHRGPQVHDEATQVRRLAYQRFTQALSVLTTALAETTGAKPLPRVDIATREYTPEVLAEKLRAPIAREVLDPEPVPVTPCALDELDGLFTHLRADAPVARQTAFARGTLMPDGRLDLCKQVVGPAGIAPLLDAMGHSRQVKRLLLGNNIVGDGGAEAIAHFIRERQDSTLDCWYIAGNHFTAEGIRPVCEALADDHRVRALWLKRNPLRAEGMKPLAEMLRRNNTLEVLDLVNCGLLDEGLETLLGALRGSGANKTLRHLYVGTNGVTARSAAALADYIAHDCALESLYLSCNRLGDDGVEAIAPALAVNRTLRRVSFASNRIGPRGAAALARALAENTSVALLDLGFTKATVAVGELGNLLGDDGAHAMAWLLERNGTLRVLDLLHNYISQRGVNAIRGALAHNTSLVSLQLTQFGRVHNEPGREEVKALLARNRARLTPSEADDARRLELPDHIAEIYSVYRTHV